MPIYTPGKRSRRGGHRGSGTRNKVVILSLTAMVDMFTVLVVFLLQNYSATGDVLYIPKEVKLPSARAVKELKPAHVVTVSNNGIYLDKDMIMDLVEVKGQNDWFIRTLHDRLKAVLEADQQKFDAGMYKTANKQTTAQNPEKAPTPEFKKLTVQADQDIDFLTVKKVMYSVTMAGSQEINFAVIKKHEETE